MTPKQEAFVREYLIDLNASGAYQRAYPNAKANSARVQACRMLADPNIAAAIAAAQAERARRTEITADRVLQELARIAFFDIRRLYNEDGSMKAPSELDDEAAAVLAGVDVSEEFDGSGAERKLIGYTKKAKVFDKGAALTLAMRHLGMLKDRLEVEDVTDRAEQMRQRRAARLAQERSAG